MLSCCLPSLCLLLDFLHPFCFVLHFSPLFSLSCHRLLLFSSSTYLSTYLPPPSVFALHKENPANNIENNKTAIQTILPQPVPVHHLGLFRDPITLAPVEYYNNLPNHLVSPTQETASDLAIILDPIIATGGTCAAAIQTLIEWGAKRVIVLSMLGAAEGVKKVAEEWPEGTEIWLAGVDQELTKGGMLKPGLGDVGDRLFLTIGK